MKDLDQRDVVEVRPRGRPKVKEALTQLSIRVPPAYYDRLVKIAAARDQGVSAVARHLLILRLK